MIRNDDGLVGRWKWSWSSSRY